MTAKERREMEAEQRDEARLNRVRERISNQLEANRRVYGDDSGEPTAAERAAADRLADQRGFDSVEELTDFLAERNEEDQNSNIDDDGIDSIGNPLDPQAGGSGVPIGFAQFSGNIAINGTITSGNILFKAD